MTAPEAEASLLLDVAFTVHNVAIAYMDCDFNFLRVNARYATVDRRSPDFFPGRNHFDLYPDARNQRIFRQVVESGEPYHGFARPFEYAHAPERGTTHWDWSLLPIKHPGGRVGGVVLVLMDVTDRIEALERIQESDDRFRGLFEHSSDALLLVDAASLAIIEANPGARQYLGYGPGEWTAMMLADLFVESGDVAPGTRLGLLAESGGTAAERLRHRDGRVLRTRLRVMALPAGDRMQWCLFLGQTGPTAGE